MNALVLVPLDPPGFVTVTLTAPAACAGVVAVIVMPPLTLTPVAALPPIVTVAPDAKFVPVIAIFVPPLVGPVAGDTVEIVGANVVYVNAFASVPD